MGTRLKPRWVLLAAVLAVGIASAAACSRVSQRPAAEFSSQGPLQVAGSEWFTYMEDRGQPVFTGLPVTLVNTSKHPVTIQSVRVLRSPHGSVIATAMIEPRSPTIAVNVFAEWPPRSTSDVPELVEPFEPLPVAGYMIPGTERWPVERSVSEVDGNRFVNDLPNEATPAFKIQSDAPDVTSRFTGLEVLYSSNGRRYRLVDRDVEFGICSAADTRNSTCQAPEN